jgi:hypothetical protein
MISRENRTVVFLNGEIAEGDARRLKDILKASSNSGKPVSGIRLNSAGGSLLEGVRLAAVIQGANVATVIAAGATCVAACFIPFVAGSQKFVSATATVGVPGAANKSGHEPAGKTPAIVRVETPAIIRVVKELGLLDAITAKMLATPEDEISWLTQDDLRAMGATTTGKPALPR